MIQRATQLPEYWEQQFTIQPDDLEHLLNLYLDDELPRTIDTLSLELVRYRCQREEQVLSRELVKGSLYQPSGSYSIDEQLVFPALQFAVGKVTAIRNGVNPDLGIFTVIGVDMDDGSTREFASEYELPHRLSTESGLPDEDMILSPEELLQGHEPTIFEKLSAQLKISEDFVRLAGTWFPRSLVADVNVGHLNLAEAMLDVAHGGPLPTETLLAEIGLPEEINPHLQVFSLNYALQQDPRFDEVGPTGGIRWFLKRLQPPEVLERPPRLITHDRSYDELRPDAALSQIEYQIDDELSDNPPAVKGEDELTFVLTYPHRRVGTLPLTPRIAALFPTGRTHRIRFEFEDARSGHRWPGWVVREHAYAFGLDTWYEANDVSAGAYVELQRGDEPGVVVIDLQGRRTKSEWVRVAQVKDGRLIFEILRRRIACDYDDLMIVVAEDVKAIDEVWLNSKATSLESLIEGIFPELVKLSPQGTAHAKSLYAAINMVHRVPPGPLFAAWSALSSIQVVGDGYAVLR